MNKRVTFILEFRIRRNIFTLNWGKTRWRKYHFQLVNASLKSLHKSFTLFDFRGAVYADMGHFERCITLWMYALDMQQKILEPLSPMTQSSLLSFAELFSFMMSEGGRIWGRQDMRGGRGKVHFSLRAIFSVSITVKISMIMQLYPLYP